MKRFSRFGYPFKVLVSQVWLFHTRWYTFCQDLGKKRLLFPLIHYLEPEIDHERSSERFNPKDLSLIPPHDSRDFIFMVISKYNSFVIYLGLGVCIITLIILKIALVPISYLTSFLGNFSALIYLVLLWPLFMLFFTIYSLIKPLRERRAVWYFEYALIEYGVSRENKVERLIAALEQEVKAPDERIEHLRELSRNRTSELKILINDLAKSKKKVKQYQKLMENNREIIFDILHTKQAIDSVERDTIEKMLRPRGILRDIGINLAANLIWSGLGFLVGISFGTHN